MDGDCGGGFNSNLKHVGGKILFWIGNADFPEALLKLCCPTLNGKKQEVLPDKLELETGRVMSRKKQTTHPQYYFFYLPTLFMCVFL